MMQLCLKTVLTILLPFQFIVTVEAQTSSAFAVQVLSQESESAALSSYQNLQARYPNLLGLYKAGIRQDATDKGVFYRAQVGPFATIEQATGLCGNLQAAGGFCIVIRTIASEQDVAQAKQVVRSQFISKFGAQQLVNEQMLTANPFVYQDKVVGVHTTFGRMIAANEALFYHDGMGMRALLASRVPPTLFTSAVPVVLAIKVRGTKAIKTPGCEAVLPYGDYVGVFRCSLSSCSEFYD
jgi:hypothetical protein